MMTRAENTLDVLKQLNLAGNIAGQGDAYVICLHGWLDNCDSFKPLFDNIEDDTRFTWLAIDLPGHGYSAWRSHDAHYYFIDYVYDLLCLIDRLGIEKCYLVGHSMGAMIANLFSACYPERVNSMVIIDGIGIVTTDEQDTLIQLKSAFRQRTKANANKQITKRFESFEKLVNARVQVSDLNYENAAILMKRNSQINEHGVELLTDPRLKQHSGFRFSLRQAQACIKDISVPTLLISSKRGFLKQGKSMENFKLGFKDLSEVALNGGHHCHMEYPEQTYAEVVGHFMQDTAT